MDSKSWWYPEKTDEKWIQRVREDCPVATEDLSEEEIREDYAAGRKYTVLWDHLGEAYAEYEKVVDAFFESLELIEKLKEEIEGLKKGK